METVGKVCGVDEWESSLGWTCGRWQQKQPRTGQPQQDRGKQRSNYLQGKFKEHQATFVFFLLNWPAHSRPVKERTAGLCGPAFLSP